METIALLKRHADLLPWIIFGGSWVWYASSLVGTMKHFGENLIALRETYEKHEEREAEVHTLLIEKVSRIEGTICAMQRMSRMNGSTEQGVE